MIRRWLAFVRSWISPRTKPEALDASKAIAVYKEAYERTQTLPSPTVDVVHLTEVATWDEQDVAKIDGAIPFPAVIDEPKALAPASTFYEHTFKARPFWLFDSVQIKIRCQSLIRVEAFPAGTPERTILMTIVTPKTGIIDGFFLLGLHGGRAEQDVTLQLRAMQPFEIFDLHATYMRPAFKREQNAEGEMMLVFLDPFYKPIPESSVGIELAAPHHRRIYGPGADVGYR